MFGSVMLDVAIGLILVYLILSLVCTALREFVEALAKDRAKLLHLGIAELLHDAELTKDLYEHPLVSSLYRNPYMHAEKTGGLPSYIPSRSFALAVLDMAARGRDATDATAAGMGATPLSVATIRQNITQLRSTKVQRVLLSALDLSGGEISKVQDELETWFNAAMDRVSGWYKRRSQWILIGLGIGLAAVVNVSTIRLALAFYKNPSQRQAAVAMAGSILKEPPAGTTPGGPGPTVADATKILASLDSLSLPIGWPDPTFGPLTLLGWLLTGLAISLGAPFWFDMLNKVMSVRTSMKPDSRNSNTRPPGSDIDRTIVITTPAAPAPAGVPGGAMGGALPRPAPVAAGAVPPPDDDYRAHEWSSGHGEAGVI